MSYSLNQKCSQCKKEQDCVDGNVIRNAVELIHSFPSRYDGAKKISAHLGGGSITHDCIYGFEDKNKDALAQ